MWKLFENNKIFSHIHVRFEHLCTNHKFFCDIFFYDWTSEQSKRKITRGKIFYYSFFLAIFILGLNFLIVFFCQVGDKRTYAEILYLIRLNFDVYKKSPMIALTPQEANQLMPLFNFLDDHEFQLFFGCSLIIAKFFVFIFIVFWCIFILKFCVFYGPEREKAINLYDKVRCVRIRHFLNTFFFFFIAVFFLFLIPGVDDFFLARQYIPPLRWIYVDFTTYFHGFYFYTGNSWSNGRVWMPNTYGSHIYYFFFHAPNIPPQEMHPVSQFVVDLQTQTLNKELDIYFEWYPRLNLMRNKERMLWDFVHKDPSVFYDFVEAVVKIIEIIKDEIDKF